MSDKRFDPTKSKKSLNYLRKQFLINSINLITLPDKWQDVLRDPVEIGHQGVAAGWWESAPPPTNLLLLNARPCCSEAVQPDKGAVARADIVAALRRVDRKQ